MSHLEVCYWTYPAFGVSILFCWFSCVISNYTRSKISDWPLFTYLRSTYYILIQEVFQSVTKLPFLKGYWSFFVLLGL